MHFKNSTSIVSFGPMSPHDTVEYFVMVTQKNSLQALAPRDLAQASSINRLLQFIGNKKSTPTPSKDICVGPKILIKHALELDTIVIHS